MIEWFFADSLCVKSGLNLDVTRRAVDAKPISTSKGLLFSRTEVSSLKLGNAHVYYTIFDV